MLLPSQSLSRRSWSAPLSKEVRYSLNSDALNKVFKFKPTDKMFESGDDVRITVPKDTQFATAQVTYLDGTTSSVQKFLRPKSGRKIGAVYRIAAFGRYEFHDASHPVARTDSCNTCVKSSTGVGRSREYLRWRLMFRWCTW